MQKWVVLLIGNHVTETTPAWALNLGTGKVKGFLFISTVKWKSDHICPSRGKKGKADGRRQSLLSQACFVGGWGTKCSSDCQTQGTVAASAWLTLLAFTLQGTGAGGTLI